MKSIINYDNQNKEKFRAMYQKSLSREDVNLIFDFLEFQGFDLIIHGGSLFKVDVTELECYYMERSTLHDSKSQSETMHDFREPYSFEQAIQDIFKGITNYRADINAFSTGQEKAYLLSELKATEEQIKRIVARKETKIRASA